MIFFLTTQMIRLRRADEAIRKIADLFRTTFESATVGVVLVDAEGRYIDVNGRFCVMIGYSRAELLAMRFMDVTPPDDRNTGIRFLSDLMNRMTNEIRVETRYIHENGSEVWALVSSTRVKDVRSDRDCAVSHIIDLTDRKISEQRVRDALAEKEVLLREWYHRTKNNMQVISSLLGLKKKRISDVMAQEALSDMINRILSMSMVHQKLYQSRNLAKIDLKEYLTEFSGKMIMSYISSPERISLSVHGDSVATPIETAIPFGLIVSEVVSNSLKYAFPSEMRGRISIDLRRKDRFIELSIGDDGVGLPPGFDIRKIGSLGIDLILNLSEKQLIFSISRKFRLSIPISPCRGSICLP